MSRISEDGVTESFMEFAGLRVTLFRSTSSVEEVCLGLCRRWLPHRSLESSQQSVQILTP